MIKGGSGDSGPRGVAGDPGPAGSKGDQGMSSLYYSNLYQIN